VGWRPQLVKRSALEWMHRTILALFSCCLPGGFCRRFDLALLSCNVGEDGLRSCAYTHEDLMILTDRSCVKFTLSRAGLP
jgi:hypothetical protein